MDIQLENLIEKIKKEGVEEARKKKERMIDEAKGEARRIVESANKEAENIIEKASAEAEKFNKNAELAIRQAARDAQLSVKAGLKNLFDRVFKERVSGTLDPDFLKDLILMIVGKWAKEPHVEIVVSPSDRKKLEKLLSHAIQKELKDKVTLSVSSDVARGFRVGLKDGDVFYDFSDESIAEMLKVYLNPRIKEILDKQDG